MKNIKKLLALVAVFVLVITGVIALAACNEPHKCGHVCPVEGCGKCLDKDCKDPVCAEKCPGHEPAPHVCGHKCPVEGCGKCLDKDCKDPVCAEKCPGHEPAPHMCQHVCPVEGCGKCLDATCTDSVCADKCPGHEPVPSHVCGHVCPVEGCGKCLDPECTDPVCADKCPGHEDPNVGYTVTLVVGEGTLKAGASTTYKTDADGKLTGYLPEPTANTAHWKFDNWYDAETAGKAIDEDVTVFDKDTTIYARYVREDGVWLGETFKAALMINGGSTSRTEYWLGGSKITLAKGDVISLYINGNLIRHYVEPNSAGINKPNASATVTSVTVSVAGPFDIYLHKNAQDWSCEYSGPTEIIAGSDIPYGCDAFTVTIGSNAPIRFFLKDADGNPVTKADFSKFCIYTYSDEIFGAWAASATQGKLKEEMTSTKTAVPNGWIFRWGSAYNQQTANIVGAFKAGKTYSVELKGHQKAPTITELTITSVLTLTLDRNYDGQPETKETLKIYNGKPNYLPTFVREGYEDKDLFWYTAAEGGEKVTLKTVFTEDATIYARWSDKLVITVDQNYDGKPENSNQPVNLGKFDTLPTADTREDYDFMGWFTAAEGGEEVTLSTVFESNSTIYAHWQAKKVITVDQNYTDKPENTTVKANHGKLTTLPAAPTREGYEFLGWFTAAEEGDRVTTSTVFEADSTIYAHWRVPFKVTLDLNYENCPEATVMTANVVSGATYSRIPKMPDVPVREGYELVGWFPNADGTGTGLAVSTNITEDVTYYAAWRVPFKVTLDLNYTDCPDPTVIIANIVPGTTFSRIPSMPEEPAAREGFEFVAWYANNDGTGTKLSTTTSISADATFYAFWRAPIKVTFNLNYEGCADPTVMTATKVSGQIYSRLSALPDKPTREGYEFVGWYTVAAATGGQTITTSTNLTSDKTYYARWKEPTKVTFNLNYEGGEIHATVTIPAGSTKFAAGTFPADPVREGYAFVGWYDVAAATGGHVIDKETGFLQSATVYARWNKLPVVTFDENYDEQPEVKKTAITADGKLAALPENPTREGFTFDGWFTLAEGGEQITLEKVYTADTTVYAHWTEVTPEPEPAA